MSGSPNYPLKELRPRKTMFTIRLTIINVNSILQYASTIPAVGAQIRSIATCARRRSTSRQSIALFIFFGAALRILMAAFLSSAGRRRVLGAFFASGGYMRPVFRHLVFQSPIQKTLFFQRKKFIQIVDENQAVG